MVKSCNDVVKLPLLIKVHSGSRRDPQEAKGMTTDVYPRDNCIVNLALLVSKTVRTVVEHTPIEHCLPA